MVWPLILFESALMTSSVLGKVQLERIQLLTKCKVLTR